MKFSNCKINNFELLERIGSGAYGLVFKARNMLDNRVYAIKAILKADYTNSTLKNHASESHIKQKENLEYLLYQFFLANSYEHLLPAIDLDSILALTKSQLEQVPHYKEIAIHLSVHDHENIVTIHHVFESSIATFIVMDYYESDLFTSIVDQQHFSNNGTLIKKVFLQICSALKFCHSKGIYHCDIKPENILLDENDNIYMCDFGLATDSMYLMPNVCVGSFYYMAPERILYSANTLDSESTVLPTSTSDIWSLGIILINLVCMRNPWLKAHQKEDSTFQFFIENNAVLQKILPISDELMGVLSEILCLEPCRRITLDRLMSKVRNIKSFSPAGPLSETPVLEEPENKHTLANFSEESLCQEFSEETRIVSGIQTPYDELSEVSGSSATTAVSSSYDHTDLLKNNTRLCSNGYAAHQRLLEEKLLKLQNEALTASTSEGGNWLPHY